MTHQRNASEARVPGSPRTVEFRVLPMEGKLCHQKIDIVAQQRSIS